jgi:hypothetical protein
MISVTREQFEVRSGLEAVHLPTGAVFRAYPYSNPEDMLRSIQVQWGRAGSPPLSGDDVEQIRRVASQLLLERARHDMEDRLVLHAA